MEEVRWRCWWWWEWQWRPVTCPSIVIIGTFSFHFSRRIASSSSIRSAYL